MNKSDVGQFVVDDMENGRITRRDLVRYGAALGLIGSALAGWRTSADARAALQDGTPATGSGAADTGLLTAPEPNPKRGGSLRTTFGVTTANYDIHQGANAAVMTQMYDGLVRFNPLDGLRSVIPSLATSWDVSDDSLSYTFHLRDGVTFHDDEPLSADDVVASFSRIISPPEGMISVLQTFFRSVERVEAVDAMTVRFSLTEPQADLMLALAAPFSVVYSKKTLDANNQDLRQVIAPGTGPFVYGEYQQNERWILPRNPNYWNPELPYLDQLEMLNVPAWSDRGTAVLTGQADFSWNVSRETYDAGQQQDGVDGTGTPAVGCYAVIINTQKKPFDDPRVRQAMFLVLNRPALIDAYRTQENLVLTRWVTHASEYAMPQDEIAKLPGYRADKTEDIATAKQLMADAGYPDGFGGIEFLSASVAPHAEIMSPAIVDMLKSALNIEATIRVTERSLLLDEESNGNFDLVLDTPTIAISDFSAVGHLYFATGGSQNFGKYSDQTFDDLLHSVDIEFDHDKRRDLLRQVEDGLDQNPPWLLVAWGTHLPMWRSYVKGLNMEERTHSVWGRLDTAWLDQ